MRIEWTKVVRITIIIISMIFNKNISDILRFKRSLNSLYLFTC